MRVWLKDEQVYGTIVKEYAHFSVIEYTWGGHEIQEVFETDEYVTIDDLKEELVNIDSKDMQYWVNKAFDELQVPLTERDAVKAKMTEVSPPMNRRELENNIVWAKQQLGL